MRTGMRTGMPGGGLVLAIGPATCVQAADVAIHAGHLIDGTGARPRDQVTILVHDDRIVSVTPGFTQPAGARVVDLSDSTVLPGLIDCHVHITSQFDGGDP